MEIKTDALVLRAVDYGENDKMATLLTADRGKLGAAVKGVRKANARLKFAAQPFCFAEFVLAERGGRHTVISASLHDGFYPLCEDIGAFYAATTVMEAADRLMYEGIVSREMLVAAVTALGQMCMGEVSLALIRFLLTAQRLAGYPIVAADCPLCGKPLAGKLRFDMSAGAFACFDCGKGTPASESTYRTIRAALGTGPQLPEGEARKDGEKRALRLLYSYFTYQTDSALDSLPEYIKML